jgi:hypothetical protein
MRSHGDCCVNSRQNVFPHEIALAEHPDGRAIAVKKGSMFGDLLELDLGHGHERINLVLGALEVLDTKSIDGHHLDASLVADLEYLGGVSMEDS